MASLLFSPLRLGGLTLSNRIVVAPMAQYSADTEGRATSWHLMHIGNMAVSGVSLVMMEATAVEPEGRISLRCPGLWNDAQMESLKTVVDFCKLHGAARIGIQLAHSGRKGSITAPWEKQRVIPSEEGGWQPVSCSSREFPGRPAPRVLDAAALGRLKDAYVAAARRADGAGFDALELHCAHGYLLHSFLSPLINDRCDRYGGDIEGRMRFPLEVFDAMREAWPTAKAVGVRVSGTDWIDGGWTLDDSVVFASALKARGCDYVSASSGGTLPSQVIPVGPSYQVFLAEGIRKRAGIPVVAAGIINQASQAEGILQAGSADLVAIGRGLTYDPRWAWHAAAELGESVYFPPQYARSHPSMRLGDFYKVYKES